MPLKDGYYTAGRESTASLKKIEEDDYEYKYETLDGAVYLFDKKGKLLRQEGLNGVGLLFNCAIMNCVRSDVRQLDYAKKQSAEELDTKARIDEPLLTPMEYANRLERSYIVILERRRRWQMF